MGLSKQNTTQQNSTGEQSQSLNFNSTTVSENRSKRSIFDIGELIFNLWLSEHELVSGKWNDQKVTTQASTTISHDLDPGLDLSLINAVEQNDLKKVKELVEKGADVNVRNQYGQPLLHIANWYPHSGIREYLIEKGASEEEQVTTEQQIIELQETTSTTIFPEQLNLELVDAVEEPNLEKVKEYIEKGANVNTRNHIGETLLHAAAYQGDLDIAEYLIEKGADVNSDVERFGKPLHAAIVEGNLNMVELLLNSGANINVGGRYHSAPLLYAIEVDQLEVASFLINKGADVNVTEERSGKTPLHLAAEKGRKDIVELLLSCKGIDINAVR
ncbi:ankyrin repeat domain-containing protein [Wolbachia endosymbiont of Ctenocephalides felis wCfeT]|uniref:ankyrin repeat domain-containing protein n=1 Tax=Wolbachia endosymbiont of Ctenocephalides felis wCfeT TaxID=2732593 RepID=UPI001446D275|nr:ankyrin repeat domain-containing protein [Wolbachia endosymbiont of Ctenocephalides felis wCfeT]